MKERVSPEKTLNEASKELKNAIQAPDWASFAKTGTHKQRPPQQEDWWYMRAASVLRAVEMLGPVGVSKLRTKYGGRKNRGAKPERFKKGSGNVLRKILQQLEKAELLRMESKSVHKGRVVTAKGKALLNNSHTKALAVEPKEVAPKVEKPAVKAVAPVKKEEATPVIAPTEKKDVGVKATDSVVEKKEDVAVKTEDPVVEKKEVKIEAPVTEVKKEADVPKEDTSVDTEEKKEVPSEQKSE